MTPLEKTVQRFGYGSVEDFAKDQVKMLLMSKIEEYRIKETAFQKKYKKKFRDFELQLKKMKNQEDFEMEDDYLEWRFCYESLLMYRKELKELEA